MNTGTNSRCIVDHKLLVAIVCKTLTQNIIIAHNHPSGSLQPSNADKQLTWKMQEILKPFDVHVLDHLI
ncbi:JAB domain-containing protein, partial [Elizabethkingia meningoseptica]